MWDRFLGVHGVLNMKKKWREDYIHNPYISHIPSYSIIFHHIPSYLSNDDLSSGFYGGSATWSASKSSGGPHSQKPIETRNEQSAPAQAFFMNNQHVYPLVI
jgi:hypothetical protein